MPSIHCVGYSHTLMIIFRLDKGRFKFEQQFQEFNEWNEFWGKFSKKSEIKTGKRPISENQFSKIGLFLIFLSFFKIDRKLSVT